MYIIIPFDGSIEVNSDVNPSDIINIGRLSNLFSKGNPQTRSVILSSIGVGVSAVDDPFVNTTRLPCVVTQARLFLAIDQALLLHILLKSLDIFLFCFGFAQKLLIF